ncbi:MAG: M14 family metallopeptidase, partial [Candidatus Aminicenantes bacterium]|nr:M14 family metallopeptidase [Candidatus Aminicenantes bacterium]
MPFSKKSAVFILILLVLASLASAQGATTSPKQEFGFNVGDDYQLINFTQLLAYWKKLDAESDRMSMVNIGTSSEGRPMVMAIITSPRNHGRLDFYKQIAKKLALAKGLTDAEAKRLSVEGKAVVWIDGGLHASEIVGSQQLIELVYQMLSGKDAETLRILDEVILLATPVNPDGLELVANWYMRDKDPLKRSMSGLPRLYQKYVGHDNNRDYYMVTQPETEAVSRQLYIEWHPQFLYNHHQAGPAGTVLFCPPFRDPFYYYFDPLVPVGTDLLGLAMHERFAAENKPGAIMRTGASYSTWWNGGLRSTGYFHNIIGILTEMIGNPTPMDIPFIPDRVLPKGDYPFPIMPQKWHMRQSIDYSITADKAILDFASRRREEVLTNRYIMGKNAIAKGSRDNWTFEPRQIAALQAQIEKDRAAAPASAPAAPPAGQGPGGGLRGGGSTNIKYYEMLRDPSKRDPRGFIIPADQPDFPTATKFVNTLIKSGVVAHRATQPFTVGGKTYPQGSYIIKTAQAFRSHVISMFEPQDHPNDFAYPGGPPRAPYDSAGWTVAFQMGIQFDRILEGFDGPFQEVQGFAKAPAGAFPAANAKNAVGFLVSHQVNDAFILTNRLLKTNEEIYWMKKPFQANGKDYPAGTIYIPAKPSVLPVLEKAAKDLGLNIEAADLKLSGEAFRLKAPRIGVWDNYGGSMDSGWAQWILTQFEFPFEVVYAPTLD